MNSNVEILLVEDNSHDIELTLHAFQKNHIANRVHVVRDGAEALEYAFCTGAYADRDRNNIPRLILLDIKLPKIDGIEVLRQLKANPLTRLIPVVVLTASRQESDLMETYEVGVNSYIVKPVDFGQFVEAIRNLGLYWLILNELPSNLKGPKPCNP